MSQSDQFDNYSNGNNGAETISDTYTTESSADIYNTPDVSGSLWNDTPTEETVDADVVLAEAPTEVAIVEAPVSNNTYYSDPYANDPYYNNPYAGQTAQNDSSYDNPYANNPYGYNPYGYNPYGGQTIQGNNAYTGQTAQNNGQYGNPYNNNPYENNPYGGQNTQNNNPYGGQNTQNSIPYGGQNTQNSIPYGGQNMQNGIPYGGQTAQNNGQYGNNQFNNNQYGNPPYGNNQYSPYAVPPKKNNTGLIIGIVVAVIMLFLFALGALTYKLVTLYSEEKDNRRSVREEYNFDDDESDKDRNQRDNDRYHDDDNDYDYDYDDDEYYTLHDDIKSDLSYSVDTEYYLYDTDYENVYIVVTYPVISSKDGSVPNLDKLNSTIASEIDFLVEYFEDEYEEYFVDDDDSYFQASSTGYVTYMDEEKMSIVFSEQVYNDYYEDFFLYSINIDMENGVILDNESMIKVDDDFSVEFREKSDIQNGEISYLTKMSDQEITDHFDSTDIIVFYTPQGMEIGFNYEEGWVTVTYKDYEKYLKVF